MTNTNKIKQTKSLSGIKIFYVLLGLIIIGVIILLASGAFDNNVVTELQEQAQSQVQSQENSNSPNLANLNEISKLEEAVKQNPNDSESLLSLAHLLNDSGFFDKAIDNYKKYLNINSNVPDVWVDMGVCYYNIQKNEDAIAAMTKAIEINPRHQIGLFNLGIVHFSSGKMDEAKKYWQRSIDVNPSADIAKKAQELINSH